MKLKARHINQLRDTASGFTLIEMMTSIGLGAVLLAVVTILFINGSWSFVAMGNYQNMDAKSTTALDIYSREIRNATGLVAYNPGTSLTLTNATAGTRTTMIYNGTAHTLMMVKTSSSEQTVQTNLTGCDSWSFSLYDRIPHFSSTNISFSITNTSSCKLINMTWKCSRTILGSKLNTESVQTAQVVLRNKVN
jgi:prepilin-type N-terminal cleavage/methylation domain-containing protein